jgi:hypothetical protein
MIKSQILTRVLPTFLKKIIYFYLFLIVNDEEITFFDSEKFKHVHKENDFLSEWNAQMRDFIYFAPSKSAFIQKVFSVSIDAEKKIIFSFIFF